MADSDDDESSSWRDERKRSYLQFGLDAMEEALDVADKIIEYCDEEYRDRQPHSDPGTARTRQTWLNRLNWFRQNILKRRPDEVPSLKDVEYFFCAMPKILFERNWVRMSHVSLKDAMHLVINSLAFEHESFVVNKRLRDRLDSIAQKAVDHGYATKEPAREKFWITCLLIKRIVIGMLSDAIGEGTHSWDVTCSKVLSLILQSALCCRAGDIACSPGYEQEKFMEWKDIEMKHTEDRHGIKVWTARCTLRHQKGHKDDPQENARHILRATKVPEDFVICPVRWLLILALRTGMVNAKTIEELEMAVSEDPNAKLEWTDPERPVLCAFTPHACALILDKAAIADQISENLKQGCELIGMSISPTSHDIRRGAARDIAQLPQPLIGASTSDSARLLGHRIEIQSIDYIGDLDTDVWQLRCANGYVDPFGPTITGRQIKRQRLSRPVIESDDDDDDHNSNRSSTTNPPPIDPHPQELKGAADPLADSAHFPDDSTSFITKFSRLNVYMRAHTHHELDGASGVVEGGSRDPASRYKYQCKNYEQCGWDFYIPADRDRHEDKCNPKESRFVCQICKRVLGGKQSLDKHMMSVHKTWIPQTCDDEDCTSTEIFQTSSEFSKHRANFHSTWSPRACPHCPGLGVFEDRKKFSRHVGDEHRDECSELKPPRTEKRNVKPRMPEIVNWVSTTCLYPNCQHKHTFKQREGYLKHLKSKHRVSTPDSGPYMPSNQPQTSQASDSESSTSKSEWTPAPCAYPDCGRSFQYINRYDYLKHLRVIHGVSAYDADSYMPPDHHEPVGDMEKTQCQYPGCEHKKRYIFRDGYRAHLRTKHGLFGNDAAQYMPEKPEKSDNDTLDTLCRYPNCQSRRRFTSRYIYETHIFTRHGVKSSIQQYMPDDV